MLADRVAAGFAHPLPAHGRLLTQQTCGKRRVRCHESPRNGVQGLVQTRFALTIDDLKVDARRAQTLAPLRILRAVCG